MTPVETARRLRVIAARLDASENPSKTLVAAELRRVIAGMGKKLKLVYENTSYAKSSGHWYTLRLKEIWVDGKPTGFEDDSWDGLLNAAHAESEYPYYSDEGPAAGLKICGKDFDPEALKDLADMGELVEVETVI